MSMLTAKRMQEQLFYSRMGRRDYKNGLSHHGPGCLVCLYKLFLSNSGGGGVGGGDGGGDGDDDAAARMTTATPSLYSIMWAQHKQFRQP